MECRTDHVLERSQIVRTWIEPSDGMNTVEDLHTSDLAQACAPAHVSFHYA